DLYGDSRSDYGASFEGANDGPEEWKQKSLQAFSARVKNHLSPGVSKDLDDEIHDVGTRLVEQFWPEIL
ncbi:MAG: hypothetical protein ABIK65_08045, partial [Candidatus Eisenbacteria bacterium]